MRDALLLSQYKQWNKAFYWQLRVFQNVNLKWIVPLHLLIMRKRLLDFYRELISYSNQATTGQWCPILVFMTHSANPIEFPTKQSSTYMVHKRFAFTLQAESKFLVPQIPIRFLQPLVRFSKSPRVPLPSHTPYSIPQHPALQFWVYLWQINFHKTILGTKG